MRSTIWRKGDTPHTYLRRYFAPERAAERRQRLIVAALLGAVIGTLVRAIWHLF